MRSCILPGRYSAIISRGFSQCVLLHSKKSSSSSRWIARQKTDFYAREAKIQQYKSRAAFKLIEIDKKYKLFSPGMTVVDLGFAPGSWSQVSVERTQPQSKVIGVDLLPCAPPRGVNAIQGNFLSKRVQDRLKQLLYDPMDIGRNQVEELAMEPMMSDNEKNDITTEAPLSYINKERRESANDSTLHPTSSATSTTEYRSFPVDIVLSDMCGFSPQESGFWLRSVTDPHNRLANTTGLAVKDHGASVDLCDAALMFAIDTLRPGGNFVCKFYTGKEDKNLEQRLKKVFKKVHREKPDSSRDESREMFFIGIGKREDVKFEHVFR
ncbi:23S ribosomal RNA methyltransferase [Nadsonia fulvescens var. elongata DSM 6958]|uniref:rRNA methyltransferase 2, mitochondrial n=1 Tax=Nadsonia fulvescens var. elongata DSM 6958 TaxID=857566 RepID=A0A1E3PQV9_9ASCO|nr:23S ribosomal RNA methyltransferase [Nadsonia fulvescens var. elongata DSM 6958]